jgi:RNA polymerase sigma factor (TIGR02999 family)
MGRRKIGAKPAKQKFAPEGIDNGSAGMRLCGLGSVFLGDEMASIAALVASADGGDPRAAEELFTALYSELQGIARRELARRGGRNPALGVSSLIHQAYLAMAGGAAEFPDRGRFLAYAARVMRGLIIDHARQRRALKRGAEFELTTLESDAAGPSPVDAAELDAINDALAELAQVERELVEVVDLKFFCGFTLEEIAALQIVSLRTVERRWERARLFLHRTLRDPQIG